MPVINVPGFGPTRFPDDMSNTDIEAAIKSNMSSQQSPMQQSSQLQAAATNQAQQSLTPQTQANAMLQNFKDIGRGTENFILGAGDAVRNQLAKVLGNVPGINIAPQQSSEGAGYNIGSVIGEGIPYIGAAGATKAALKGAEQIPHIGKLAQYLTQRGLGGAIGGTLGTGTYGALTNPDNREAGFAIGAGSYLAPSALGAAINAFRPQAFTKQIMDKIIPEYRNAAKKETASLYRPVIEKIGNERVYDSVQNILPEVDKDIFKKSDLTNLYKQFKYEPNFKNAHSLQSQLGTRIEGLKSKGGMRTADEYYLLSQYEMADKSLNKAMLSAAEKNPEALKDYFKAQDYYKNRMVPFEVASLAIHDKLQQGKPTPEDVSNLLHSLPAKITSHDAARQSGLRNVPDEITQLAHALDRKRFLGKSGSVVTGGGLGAVLGHMSGFPGVGEIIGAGVGAGIAPQVSHYAGAMGAKTPDFIKKLIPNFDNLPDMAKKIITANLIAKGSSYL